MSEQNNSPSILLYPNQMDALDDLTDAQVGQVFRAVFAYANGTETSPKDPLVKLAYKSIKIHIDRDRQKYAARCKKLKENGSKGGRPKSSKNQDAAAAAEEEETSNQPDNTDSFQENQENQMVFRNHNTIQYNTIQYNEFKNPSIEDSERTESLAPIPAPSADGAGEMQSWSDEPSLEFVELRQHYDCVVKPEGPQAGFAEYKQLKASRDMTGHSRWPGLSRILDDISKRMDAGVWGKGYEIGLARYLRERTWLAPIQPRQTDAAKSWDKRETERNLSEFRRRVQAKARDKPAQSGQGMGDGELDTLTRKLAAAKAM